MHLQGSTRAPVISTEICRRVVFGRRHDGRTPPEIERVIFEAHPLAERDGTIDFDELRKLRTNWFTEARVREEDALSDISDRIGAELEKIKIVDLLRRQANDKLKLIEGYTKDRLKLIVKGSEARLKRHSELIAAAEKVRSYLRFFAAKQQSLLAIKDEVGNLRKHVAPEALKKMSERHRASALKGEEWPSSCSTTRATSF